MGTPEEWEDAIGALRRAADPHAHPALGHVHKLALADGMAALKSFWQLDEALKEDVICGLLVAELEQLLRAERPRSYFIVAVRRRAIDQLRRRERERSARGDGAEDSAVESAGDQADPNFVLDARRALAALSERDLRIVSAVGLGEDREALAAHHGISRAAVDQIVSRVRKRLGREEP